MKTEWYFDQITDDINEFNKITIIVLVILYYDGWDEKLITISQVMFRSDNNKRSYV